MFLQLSEKEETTIFSPLWWFSFLSFLSLVYSFSPPFIQSYSTFVFQSWNVCMHSIAVQLQKHHDRSHKLDTAILNRSEQEDRTGVIIYWQGVCEATFRVMSV